MLLSLVMMMSISRSAFASFPDTIEVKTPTESFSGDQEFAVRDGKIWTKKAADPSWSLFDFTGLPHGLFRSPDRITEIYADGPSIVALDGSRTAYFKGPGAIGWTNKLGLPFGVRMQVPSDARGWALGNMNGLDSYYVDIAGTPHRTLGVNTIYVLEADGRRIAFDDPWLTPNHFDHLFTTPRRGELVAESISAGGSTMMVVDSAGAIYTRQLDTDSVGADPFIHYSYKRESFHYAPLDAWSMARALLPGLLDVWALPNEDWLEQPSVPESQGRITKNTTVLLINGHGNSERELRIEGIDAQGRGGYFTKRIYADHWDFVATGKQVTGPFLGDGTGDNGNDGPAPFDSSHEGRLGHTHARLDGFNYYFNDATVSVDGLAEPVTLHTHPSFYPIHDGQAATIWGAIEMPQADHEAFCGKRFIKVRVKSSAKEIRIDNENPFGCQVHFRFH